MDRLDVQRNVISSINEYPLQVFIAPTGFGKSTLFRLAIEHNQRVLHILPLRAIIKNVLEKGLTVQGVEDFIAYQASIQKLEVDYGGKKSSIYKDPYLLSPYVVTTYDSMSLAMLVVPLADMFKSRAHWDLSYVAFLNRLLILDEAHMLGQSDDVEGFLPLINIEALVHYLVKNLGCKAIFSSATIPFPYLDVMVRLAGVQTKMVIVGGNRLLSYYKNRIGNIYTHEAKVDLIDIAEVYKDDEEYREVYDIYKEHVRTAIVRHDIADLTELVIRNELGDRVLVVLNTVKRAVEVYKMLKSSKIAEANGYTSILLHSRLGVGEKEERVRNLDEMIKHDKKVVVVATQVIEAGLDRHFDTVVSEFAPLESIIQRFGRTLRNKEDCRRIDSNRMPVRLILSMSENSMDSASSVYDTSIINKTASVLQNLVTSEYHSENGIPFYRIDWRYGEDVTGYALYEHLDDCYLNLVRNAENNFSNIRTLIESIVIEQIVRTSTDGGRARDRDYDVVGEIIERFEISFNGFIRQGALLPLLVVENDKIIDVVEVSTKFIARRRELVVDNRSSSVKAYFEVCKDLAADHTCEICSESLDSRWLSKLMERPLTSVYHLVRRLGYKGYVIFLGLELVNGNTYSKEYGLV